jgi:dTDP-4-dehydrorhamnose 3,5-epimerase
MKIIETEIPDVKVIEPQKFGDHRGFFSETYNRKVLKENGIELDFVQDNHSLSVDKGILRGLHFQTEPFAQDKLVRVISGSVYDVAVDLRKSSPTFGKHVAITLSSDNWLQLLVPKGFAHGFVTMENNTEVIYKVTNYYSPENDSGILWNDPRLGINWPISTDQIILSDKDKVQPRFSEANSYFN